MIPIRLFHEVLLHLPIQVLWRLIGRNHQLHQLMMDEFLWRRNCEQEFKVLHTKIPCYRIYWLKRTEKAYGRLFVNGVPNDQFKRVKRVYHCIDYFVLTNDHQLYRFDRHQRKQPELVFTKVVRVVPMKSSVAVVLMVLTETETHTIYTNPEMYFSNEFAEAHLRKLSGTRSSVIGGCFDGDLGIALLEDGRLCQINVDHSIVRELRPEKHLYFSYDGAIGHDLYLSLVSIDGIDLTYEYDTRVRFPLRLRMVVLEDDDYVVKFAKSSQIITIDDRYRDVFRMHSHDVRLFVDLEGEPGIDQSFPMFHGIIDLINGSRDTVFVVAQRKD